MPFVTPHKSFDPCSISHAARATIRCFLGSHTPFLGASGWDAMLYQGGGKKKGLSRPFSMCPVCALHWGTKLGCPVKQPLSKRITQWIWHHKPFPFFQVTPGECSTGHILQVTTPSFKVFIFEYEKELGKQP